MKRQPRHKLASSLILNYLSTFLKKLSHGYDKPRRRLIRGCDCGDIDERFGEDKFDGEVY
jgi:hypothetical protein